MELDDDGIWIDRPFSQAERCGADELPLPPAVPPEWLEHLEQVKAPPPRRAEPAEEIPAPPAEPAARATEALPAPPGADARVREP